MTRGMPLPMFEENCIATESGLRCMSYEKALKVLIRCWVKYVESHSWLSNNGISLHALNENFQNLAKTQR